MSTYKSRVLIATVLSLVLAAGLVVYFTRSTVDPDLRTANEAIAERQFQRASEHLHKYLLAHPDDSAIHLLAAQTARRQGDFISAFGHAAKCQQLNGQKELVDLEFRLLRMRQGKIAEIDELMATCAGVPQAPETALVMEAIVATALSILNPSPGPLVSLTDEAMPLLTQARRAVDLWLELRPGPADRVAGLFWRGRLRALAGDQEGALADLRNAIELDPDHFDARIHLAFLMAQANPVEAASHFTILRQMDPANKQVVFGQASIFRGIGRLDEATKLLDEMLATNPNEVSALVERGLVALDRTQPDEAERWLLRAYALAPNDPDVNLALSQCMHLRGDVAKAKEYRDRFDRLEKARKQQPGGTIPKK